MREEGISIPPDRVLGRAVWTLLFYIWSAGSSKKKNQGIGMEMARIPPPRRVEGIAPTCLTTVVIEYDTCPSRSSPARTCSSSFDAMGMMIDEYEFGAYALPCLSRRSRRK